MNPENAEGLQTLVVHGGYHYHLKNDVVRLVPQDHRVKCHKVDCRSIRDGRAFREGGGSGVLQYHVLRQAALLDVMTTALTIIAERRTEAAVRRLAFVCDHGKHRSRTCAEIFRALFAPRARIYSALENRWY